MMKNLLGLLTIVIALGVFSSCTSDSVEETESLQILEDQSADDRSHKGTTH